MSDPTWYFAFFCIGVFCGLLVGRAIRVEGVEKLTAALQQIADMGPMAVDDQRWRIAKEAVETKMPGVRISRAGPSGRREAPRGASEAGRTG